MSLGILGGGGSMGVLMGKQPTKRQRAAVRGLGASEIPGTCWDKSGFKTCHTQQWEKARTDCAAGDAKKYFDGNINVCIEAYADQGAIANCVPKYCPQSLPSSATTNSIMAMQTGINVWLKANGFQLLSVDGKLGPKTCGAAAYLSLAAKRNVWTEYGVKEGGKCVSFTYPTKVGSMTPVKVEVTPLVIVEQGKEPVVVIPVIPWGTKSADTLTLQRELNVHLRANGKAAISETGILDAVTCGAMQWLKQNTGQDYLATHGQNCKGYVDPTAAMVAQAEAPMPEAPPPTPTDNGAPLGPSAPKLSAASMVAGLAVVSIGGTILYMVGKKKGWFG